MTPREDDSLKLKAAEVASAFNNEAWANQFPSILSVNQAARLSQVPMATVYGWKSQGLLKGCCRKVGKHVRFFRDRLILKLLNEGLYEHKQYRTQRK